MYIVLAEERDGQPSPEQTYEGPVITVGRNRQKCQILFDQQEWRMVSRVHAEFRWEDGRCLLVDKKSSYGTFLDGAVINEPVEVRAGSRVRFGVEGPVVVVSRLGLSAAPPPDAPEEYGEDEEDEEDEDAAPVEEFEPPPFVPEPEAPPPPPEPSLHLLGDGGVPTRSFTLLNEVVRIGRDPGMDVPMGASTTVSRQHAEIRKTGGYFVLADIDSFNGTLLNGRLIAHPVPLYDGDQIQLGLHGPVFLFDSPDHVEMGEAVPRQAPWDTDGRQDGGAAQPAAAGAGGAAAPLKEGHVRTFRLDLAPHWLERQMLRRTGGSAQLVISRLLKPNAVLTIGRAEGSDICLAGLQISALHAVIARRGEEVFVEDKNSTNGVHVNGARVASHRLKPKDVVQIGPYLLRADAKHRVLVFDTRANTRVEVVEVSQTAPGGPGRPAVRLLDEVNLSVGPNEFVGVLGPSGAGKSTLLGAMNGARPAKSGRVEMNGLDLYGHLDSLKQHIGYIPQEDSFHRELTVQRTLYYVAHLRLSRDVSEPEINDLIDDILEMTQLVEQRDVRLWQLSGGQRKRAAIAVELVTKPSVIYLDEPTSGLDPVTAGRIMKLFRYIAESGRTVVMTTHLMEDVTLFHRLAVLMRGRIVFYGTPQEALDYFGVGSFKEIYDRLEAPAEGAPAGSAASGLAGGRRGASLEAAAAKLKARFRESEQYGRHLGRRPGDEKAGERPAPPPHRRPSLYEQFMQWAVLARRYMEVLAYDRVSLSILLAQAPIIGLLTFLAVEADAARDFPYFVLALVSMWLGTSAAAREIVRERAVYARERMVNTGLLPYVGSKLFVLALLAGSQCVLLFGTLKIFHYLGLMKLPGWALPQLLVMILTGLTGVALGLFISAVAKTPEAATSIVPLVLIPQLLFSGLIGVPTGPAKVVGTAMPTTWAFDEIKRLSDLPVLWGAESGGKPSERNEGRGLYKQVEFENNRETRAFDEYQADARRSLDDFKRSVAEYEKGLESFRNGNTNVRPSEPTPLSLKSLPAVRVKPPPKDLSGYVSYLHPWGGLHNPVVLLAMLLLLTGATLLALKRQDVV